MEEKNKVIINLYDLSGGMAKVFSPMFLGKQIEGIWHTGVCVFGKEYYFGGGICCGPIKQTPYGVPIKEIPIGQGTEVPEEVFNDFLEEISSKYTMEKYDLFNNNCNNFSDDCVHFLCGEKLPEYITGLPAEVLNTPIGQMLKPVIDNMQNQVVQQSGQANMFPQAFEGNTNNQQFFNQGNNNNQQQQQQSQPIFPPTGQINSQFNQNLLNQLQGNTSQQQQPQPNIDMKNVKEIENFVEFIEVTEKCKACIIDFYSQTCGPCQMIKPIFCELSEQYPDINFYMVDGVKHQDVASQFELQGYPTFITYANGNYQQKWAGANQTKLMTKLKELKEKLQ